MSSRHNHAHAQFVLGNYQSADDEIRQVVEDYQRVLGPAYPAVLAARQLHAQTQAALGHADAGVELMAEVVAGRERSLGADHHFTAVSRDLLEELRSGRWRPPQPPGARDGSQGMSGGVGALRSVDGERVGFGGGWDAEPVWYMPYK